MEKGQKVKLYCQNEALMMGKIPVYEGEYVCDHRGKQIYYVPEFCWPYYDHDPKNSDGVIIEVIT